MTRLLDAFRDELITAGIVRDPNVAGPLPPMWKAPVGVYAPGEQPPKGNTTQIGTDAVIGAYMTGGIAPPAFGQWSIYSNVELRIRTVRGYIAGDLEQAITLRLLTRFGAGLDHTIPLLGGALDVVEIEQAIPLQFLGADEQGFEHLVTYLVQYHRPGA